jgi:hypothetical protein
MGSGSVMSAMTWRRPPQLPQRRTSTATTRYIHSAQESLWSWAALQVAEDLRIEGGDGTTTSRQEEAGASTPW